ncbi:hypothetical protein J3E68DRAFT_391791 [Trichoderma sp. SZMC 28012]
MKTTTTERMAKLMLSEPVELLKDPLSNKGPYMNDEGPITEDTAEGEASERDVSEKEAVPRSLNAEGERAASSTLPGDQPLDERPQQSTAEEEFDIDKVVKTSEENPLEKMNQQVALLKKRQSRIGVLAEKVIAMAAGACEEGKNNREFWEEMAKDWEEEAKHWEEMKEYWEEQKKYWEEEAKKH